MPQTVNMLINKYISWSPTVPPPPKIQSENKFSVFLQARKLVWDTLPLYPVWLSQPMLKRICFALVCENTCTREIKTPEKKQHKRIVKIQWNLPSWNTSDVPLSTNVSSHIIHSYFPLSNPSSRLWARQLLQLPVPLRSRQRCKTPSCRQDQVQLFPCLSSHSPHRKANKQSSFIQPLSAQTFRRLTIQCFHRLSTAPSSTRLTDPKLLPSTAAPCPREEPGPCFSSSSSKVSIVNKNTRSRHRGSRWLMCQLPARTGPAVPIATPSYRSCDGLSAPSHKRGVLLALTPATATMQSHSIHFYAFGVNCWQFFSLNPMPDVFCLGLDLQMKQNALGSLGLAKALFACSLTHVYRASEII